ncbi:MAG TPA: PepSY-associated TM helix domain-containing protein [Povalibacter sp.]|nr:PepSY-associated TM helix domain-containing protein [Povalibacter sp.]
MATTARATIATEQKSRAFWLKHLHQWHWLSAAACLVGMVLFSITGFTLNHAGWIAAKPQVTSSTAELPADLLKTLQSLATDEGAKHPLPVEVHRWLGEHLSVRPDDDKAEWSPEEIYVSLPRPGGDAWMTIDLESGEVTHEITDRGWISYFNDLHKGRNTGAAWSLFIDVFAFSALIFAVTGLVLLKMHASHRPATWPMVGLGLTLPLLLAILFIH